MNECLQSDLASLKNINSPDIDVARKKIIEYSNNPLSFFHYNFQGEEIKIINTERFNFKVYNLFLLNSINYEKLRELFQITKLEFDKNGNFLHIFSITSIDENFFLHRYFDTNSNLVIDTYVANGKCIKKGYYNNKQLAYIIEGELVKDLNLLQNGKYIEYYKNGKIKVQGNYKAGRRDGEFKTFLKNGKSAGYVIYKDGKIIYFS